jgi:peptidoglycan pentaglycine glycine transferase (the first glycine)
MIELQNQEDGFESWWKILEQTKERDGFRIHGKDYYKKMLSINNFNSDEPRMKLKLLGAFYRQKLIAGNIVSFFGDTAVYVHGASSDEHRNLMAPYFLQWEAIKLARQDNIKYYDFYGIDENKWPGVSRFKKGFGGEEIDYFGTYDLVFDKKWYNVYKLIRKARRLI